MMQGDPSKLPTKWGRAVRLNYGETICSPGNAPILKQDGEVQTALGAQLGEGFYACLPTPRLRRLPGFAFAGGTKKLTWSR